MLLTKKDVVTKITMKMIFLLAAPSSAWQRCLVGVILTLLDVQIQNPILYLINKKRAKITSTEKL